MTNFTKLILAVLFTFSIFYPVSNHANATGLVNTVAEGFGKAFLGFAGKDLMESWFGDGKQPTGATKEQVEKIVKEVVNSANQKQTKKLEQFIDYHQWTSLIDSNQDKLELLHNKYPYNINEGAFPRLGLINEIIHAISNVEIGIKHVMADTNRPQQEFFDFYKVYMALVNLKILAIAEQQLLHSQLAKSSVAGYKVSNGMPVMGAALTALKTSNFYWQNYYPGHHAQYDCVYANEGTSILDTNGGPLYPGVIASGQGPLGRTTYYGANTEKMNHSKSRSMDVKGIVRNIRLGSGTDQSGKVNKICRNSWGARLKQASIIGWKNSVPKLIPIQFSQSAKVFFANIKGGNMPPIFFRENWRNWDLGRRAGGIDPNTMMAFNYWNTGILYRDSRIRGRSMYIAPIKDSETSDVVAHLVGGGIERQELMRKIVPLVSTKYTARLGNIKALHQSLIKIILAYQGPSKETYRNQGRDNYNKVFCLFGNNCPDPLK